MSGEKAADLNNGEHGSSIESLGYRKNFTSNSDGNTEAVL
jgi:hypothetical protein